MTLPEEEQKILEYWDQINIIDLILKTEKPLGRFEFTEGPPTANGLPGVHHVYSRSIKDIILRFKFMEGYWIPRKAGWDTHGLPVELEIEKELGLNTKKDILDYGIANFNHKCRESVFRYVKEWEFLTKRMGFWLDLNDAYVTCENYYIESVWWSLKQIFDKGSIYKGHKVVPYCPRCETPLSSHELSLGYEKVTEESIYIKFRLLDPKWENAKIVAWTTTPWTLISNVALAANPDSRYSLIEVNGEKLIIATSLISNLYNEGEYNKIREFFGADLMYEKYEPLFPYFEHLKEKNGFIVITADFVDTELTSDNISTGFVHIAPAFGEDDYNVGKDYDLPFIQPINEKGYFDNTVPPLKDKYFKITRENMNKKGIWDTDKWVITQLQNMDKLITKKDYSHDYPFCWRCKRALLYYARESWFIQMSRYRDDLLDNNELVNWVPNSIKNGRFGNFLDNVRDWAITRERFWGTPFPLWICSNEKCGHISAIGSFEELKKKSKGNVVLDDYHKPMIDEVIIKCEKCKSDMLRTPEVIDCWYDSGAAPFAQYHYPFENKDLIDNQGAYPVDFIAEGMDQTRGWFYTLHSIATVVFGKNAYKNVVVNGIVLDGEGRKMSKSLGNTIDPWMIFDTNGSDAIRWLYYVSGPPHKEKRLSLESVKYVVSQFITKYWNSYLLFKNNIEINQMNPDLKVNINELKEPLDHWIISAMNKLAWDVKNLLDEYEIYKSSEMIQNFVINDLSNWYLRLVRKRLLEKDQIVYDVLYYIFDLLNRLLAPYIPFMTEKIFLDMKDILKYANNYKSIHLMNYPNIDEKTINVSILDEMKFVLNLIQDLRALREKIRIKIRQPIKEFIFSVLDDNKAVIIKYEDLIKTELNVKELRFLEENQTKGLYSEKLIINKGTIGKDFKKDSKFVENYLQNTNIELIKKNFQKGRINIKNKDKEYELTKDHFQIEQIAKKPYEVSLVNYGTLIINSELNEDLLREGFARDFIRNIQNIRKKLNLSRGKEKIILNFDNDFNLQKELGDFVENVKNETGCVSFGTGKKGKPFEFKISGKNIKLFIEILKS